MAHIVNKILHGFGLDLGKFPKRNVIHRIRLLSSHNINLIFDIGANEGQYITIMRRAGYIGRVVSFEPLQSAFEVLSKVSRKDPKWLVENFALGETNEETVINIAGNSGSSSILSMAKEHEKSRPSSKYIGKQNIAVRRLDSVISSYYRDGDHLFLKIDTQGYEKMVLSGAERTLENTRGIQIELSLFPLYENITLYDDMIGYLEKRNFVLYSLEPGFTDPDTGRLLQMDGIFFKEH